MGHIVFTWEAGSGLGHVVPYLGLIEEYLSCGHTVAFIVRNQPLAARMLSGRKVRLIQAPRPASPVKRPVAMPCTFAHILHNIGFDDAHRLSATVSAWRRLFNELKPDAVFFDHSPTALLAARPLTFEKVVCGTGFTLPPRVERFPNLRPGKSADTAPHAADETRILARTNRVLASIKAPLLHILADLYAADATLLRTVPALDPYRSIRKGTRYHGLMSGPYGVVPHWPRHDVPRVFAYLKPFPLLPVLLNALNDRKINALLYIDGLEETIRKRYSFPTLAFAHSPLNLPRVAARCDLAVLNGSHDTCLQMLEAKVPMCNIPLNLEQALTADYVQDLGAGLTANPTRSDQIISGLDRLLASCRTARAPLSKG